jgi:hypothetical protein
VLVLVLRLSVVSLGNYCRLNQSEGTKASVLSMDSERSDRGVRTLKVTLAGVPACGGAKTDPPGTTQYGFVNLRCGIVGDLRSAVRLRVLMNQSRFTQRFQQPYGMLSKTPR